MYNVMIYTLLRLYIFSDIFYCIINCRVLYSEVFNFLYIMHCGSSILSSECITNHGVIHICQCIAKIHCNLTRHDIFFCSFDAYNFVAVNIIVNCYFINDFFRCYFYNSSVRDKSIYNFMSKV